RRARSARVLRLETDGREVVVGLLSCGLRYIFGCHHAAHPPLSTAALPPSRAPAPEAPRSLLALLPRLRRPHGPPVRLPNLPALRVGALWLSSWGCHCLPS